MVASVNSLQTRQSVAWPEIKSSDSLDPSATLLTTLVSFWRRRGGENPRRYAYQNPGEEPRQTRSEKQTETQSCCAPGRLQYGHEIR